MKRKTKWRVGWTSWRADKELLAALDEIAARREQSRSTVVRNALKAFIERETAEGNEGAR